MPYFNQENEIVFCHNVEGILKRLGVVECDPNIEAFYW